MPGGLLRIAGEDRQIVSGQRGGSSKDTWVSLPSTPAETAQPAEWRPADDREHAEQTTSSRAAEHLFWLGRYAERSETCGRLLRAVLSRLTETGEHPAAWRTLFLRTCRRQELLPAVDRRGAAKSRALDTITAIERALISGMFDRQKGRSLVFNVEQTVRVAGAVRDRLSSDNWRLLNHLFQSVAAPAGGEVDLDAALELIDETIISLVAVGGLEMAHMTRNDGWRFLSIGRHLERLAFIVSTLEDVIGGHGTGDPVVLDWLLDLSDSRITYRARHRSAPEWPAVLDLLVFDPHNPRSVLFQVAKLAKHVRLLPDGDLIDVLAEIDGLRQACHAVDPAQRALFADADRPADLLKALARLARSVSDALTLRYFSHVYDLPHATVTF
jgi:uncharacterized alpha-E superfamily protein